MKLRLFASVGIFLFSVSFAQATASQSPSDELRAMDGLIHRILPGHEDRFRLELIASRDGKDAFELEGKDGQVVIRGNNALSLATGLNWYLKHTCHISVSYYKASPIQLPETLPLPTEKLRRESACKSRFFLNYCTFGYSMPWWGFPDWERLIDWMALNGINMPLAITGQEAAWQKVWRKLGIPDDQIRAYFTGPAHLPWHRMTNIDRWNGPLPQGYIDNQMTLQKKILQREREFGMAPVLPAFAGHVPEQLREVRPAAKITNLKPWEGFPKECSTWFLDPKDPLFTEIQKLYLEEQTRLFGTDHIYGADPLNEMEPPSWEPEYLADVASTIYNSMAAVDPDAQWLQMGWLFYHKSKDWTQPRIKAMLRAVPQDKIILLDYFCERTEVWKQTDAFFGQPYIWCYLGNFGGATSINGDLKDLDKRLTHVLGDPMAGKMVGVGGTLEAFSPNTIFYDYLFERPWFPGKLDLENWVEEYALTRTGQPDENISKAWKLLVDKIYLHSTRGFRPLMTCRPSRIGHGRKPTNPDVYYDRLDLLEVWRLMLLAKDTERDSYRQDLALVVNEAISRLATPLRDQMVAAYEAGDKATFERKAAELLALFKDVDRMAATRIELLLGAWIADARSFGKNEAERNYYEHDARNLLTTWGPKGNGLNDYANRLWAGLVGDYYHGRWALLVSELRKSLESGRKFDEKAFNAKVAEYEWNWTLSNKTYAGQPAGDTVQIARELYKKYAPMILGNAAKIKEISVNH